MAEFIQGTTPSLGIEFPNDVPVSSISFIDAVVYQGDIVIHKYLDDMVLDIHSNTMYLNLTEEDTLSFSGGVVKIQARYRIGDDSTIFGTYSVPVRVIPLGVCEPLTFS